MKEWTSFTERLHFVTIDNRIFAVMAYSADDAWRQVRDALYLRFALQITGKREHLWLGT